MPRSVANALLNQQFRQALTPGAGHLMPGAANALAARVIEATGHRMLMVGGAAVANTYLGAPDIGLVSLAELAGNGVRVGMSCGRWPRAPGASPAQRRIGPRMSG